MTDWYSILSSCSSLFNLTSVSFHYEAQSLEEESLLDVLVMKNNQTLLIELINILSKERTEETEEEKKLSVLLSILSLQRKKNKNSLLHLIVLSSSFNLLKFFGDLFSSLNKQEDLFKVLSLSSPSLSPLISSLLSLEWWKKPNIFGETPLHLAASRGDPRLLAVFLSSFHFDQDIFLAEDRWQRRPVEIAYQNGYKQLIFSSKSCVADSSSNLLLSDEFLRSEIVKEEKPEERAKPLIFEGFLDQLKKKSDLKEAISKVKEQGIFKKEPNSTSIINSSPGTLPLTISLPFKSVSFSKTVEFPFSLNDITLRLDENKKIIKNVLKCMSDGHNGFSSLSDNLVDFIYHDPNGKDFFGLSVVHKAASWNSIDLLDLFLKYNQDVLGLCIEELKEQSSNSGGYESLIGSFFIEKKICQTPCPLLKNFSLFFDFTIKNAQAKSPLILAKEENAVNAVNFLEKLF